MVPAGDFGHTEIKSRLTGERVVLASTVWNGTGRFEYPDDSMFSTTPKFGYSNPDPDEIIYHQFFFSRPAEPAWEGVRDTDVINRLAALGAYEVFVFDHFYSVGVGNPTTAEWIIVAFTHPPAPDDMAVIDMVWPRTLVTREVPATPEIVVHNFGDGAEEVDVVFTVSGSSGTVHEERQSLGSVPADVSQRIFFEPVTNMGLESMAMSFTFLDPAGQGWEDAYPANDAWDQVITVTDQPVFRRTYGIPTNGLPVDVDNDGDMDIAQHNQFLKIWQNDGSGHFTDITDQSPVVHKMWPRTVVSEDFNGDGHADALVVFWGGPPQLLVGDGTGVFTDWTDQSGLSSVNGFGSALPLDKENDGDMDLVFPVQGQEIVMENDGTGRFTDVSLQSGIIDPDQTQTISAGDLNNDGFLDVVLVNWQTDPTVFINDGHGRFSLLPASWGLLFGRGALVFDYDDDGLSDIIFYQQTYHGACVVFRNEGNLVFEDASAEAGGVPGSFRAAAGDVNMDGEPDLVLGDGLLWLNTAGVFVDHTALLVDIGYGLGQLGRAHVVDLDGDGDVDILGESSVYLSQLRQPGGPSDPSPPDPMPQQARLEQNFPNPFNPGTTIRYLVSQRAHVILEIYNVAGQRVRTLVNQIQSPRTDGYRVRWDGRNNAGQLVGSGVYLYRLETAGSVQTKKMVLLR
jgi:hypothetical protein